MNKSILKKVITAYMVLLSAVGYGQQVEMADTMRKEGKIYVVVAVLVTVFVGLIIYLIIQENRLSKIEKKLNNKNE